MKPTIILQEKPILFLKGIGGLVLLAILLYTVFSIVNAGEKIIYIFLSFCILILFILFIRARNATCVLTETGFEYAKGKHSIKGNWDNVDDIGIHTSRGYRVGFFIVIKNTKTSVINFSALEKVENGNAKRIKFQETCDLLENYSGKKPEKMDYFMYGKFRK